MALKVEVWRGLKDEGLALHRFTNHRGVEIEVLLLKCVDIKGLVMST